MFDRSMDEHPLSFPGGNDGIARHIVKTLIPDPIPGGNTLEAVCRNNIDFQALDRSGQPARIRLASTAIWVQHEGNPSTSSSVVVAYTRAGKLYRVKAHSVVMAGGCWTTKRVIRDLPSTHRQATVYFHGSRVCPQKPPISWVCICIFATIVVKHVPLAKLNSGLHHQPDHPLPRILQSALGEGLLESTQSGLHM
jgi:hypothetical protein